MKHEFFLFCIVNARIISILKKPNANSLLPIVRPNSLSG